MVLMGHYFTNGNDCYASLYSIQLRKIKSLKNYFRPDKTLVILDDGLRCHLEASDILRSEGFSVACAIPNSIFEKTTFLDVHKAHLIIAQLNKSDLETIIKKYFNFTKLKQVVLENNFYAHQNSALPEKIFKYLVNYRVEDTSEMLNEIFARTNETSHKEFYLQKENLEYLKSINVQILPHSVNHQNLANLAEQSPDKLEEELKNSIDFAKQFNDVDSFVMPYGTETSINDKVVKSMKLLGVKNIFVARKLLSNFEISDKELLRPRIDLGAVL